MWQITTSGLSTVFDYITQITRLLSSSLFLSHRCFCVTGYTKMFPQKLFLKLLFTMYVADDIPLALEKPIKAEVVSRNIQSRISRICSNIIIFIRMFKFALPVYMATNLMPISAYKMVTYLEEFLFIESHGSLIVWSCKITWQAKIMSTLLQSLWPPNLAGWWLTLTDSYLQSNMVVESRAPVRLLGKLKPLYLHQHLAYSHQT